jgi:glycosyltransferase involved in cell wall biosynthesis
MGLGYLSGAPRVSTHFNAEAAGARAHVLGLIKAFEGLNWEVKPFIVGDRVPQKWVMKGSEQTLSSGFFPTLAADLVRLVMNVVNGQQAWRELQGQVDWVYERFASLQSLGQTFKRHGVPWILETNGPFFYEAKTERKSLVLTGPARWVEIRAYQQCDVLVCISEVLKEIVVREASIPPEKVVVVPNGVDTAFFDPEQHKPKYLFEDFTIGFVGGLLAWQGLDLLLEALHDLRAEGMNMSLVVMGDGPMQPVWEAQAQQLGISTNVMFVGRKPWQEVPQYIAGFDVGYSGQVQLQAQKMYHSPLKLYEYMAMAKPVVASAFEDAQRVIRDRETGFLFQAGSKDDLKRALVGVYQCRDVLPEMGRRAREEVVANHSWRDRMQTMIDRVEQILKERNK